jgi:transketolase
MATRSTNAFRDSTPARTAVLTSADVVSSHRLLSRRIRRIVLEQSWRAGTGHIGSALSVVDLLAVLFGGAMNVPAAEDPERDRFVLSKGHAALALYAALYATERLSGEELESFCVDGSPIATHPEHVVPGIDFSTGSLGQGLSYAVGAALAARLQGSPRRAFALLSDAECDEGSIWEAVMFAAHHRLGNVIALVDVNGQQALGYTRDVLDLTPLSVRWRAFGWDVHDVDGHDAEGLSATLAGLERSGPPHVLLAHTTFGRGVSYMESAIPWHYRSMSEQQYEQALWELEAQTPEPPTVEARARKARLAAADAPEPELTGGGAR